jgi:peroxiredoxin/predicted 2-oxoglutarate/Fe(II)-dependent dioxygenase YbiX
MAETLIIPGEPAPWFTAPCTSNPKFHFETVAGRYIVLCFFQSAETPVGQQILQDLQNTRDIFDDDFCCFFGVSVDPEDQKRFFVREQIPGIRFFWDFDYAISRQFEVGSSQHHYQPCTYILDERLRVLAVLPIEPSSPENHVASWIEILSRLPPLPTGHATVQAPILVVPRIFEPDLCAALIDYYNQHGGEESGFMREVQGRTIHISDHSFKRRRDQEILDQDLRNAAMHRIHDRLKPEIHKAFQFQVSRIERHIVACYDSVTGGFFRPHRDNTTKGTAHRRFAVSLNLNTGEYEGGMLRFPEFGKQTYTAPAGGAVVFSCSLLHEATPVTEGVRYAYLPFLYDDEAARIRQKNQRYIGKADSEYDQRSPTTKQKTKAKGFQKRSSQSKHY